MHVRIGSTLDGRPVVIDSVAASTTLVLGDPGTGKTTIARHLVRWWLARTRDVQVFTSRPAEWVDLDQGSSHLAVAARASFDEPPRGAATLRVLDGLHDVDEQTLGRWSGSGTTTLICAETSWAGGWTSRCTPAPVSSFGLIPRSQPMVAAEDRSALIQGRLDWAPGTIPLICECRGSYDFPPHRWNAARHTPTSQQASNDPSGAGAGVGSGVGAGVGAGVGEGLR